MREHYLFQTYPLAFTPPRRVLNPTPCPFFHTTELPEMLSGEVMWAEPPLGLVPDQPIGSDGSAGTGGLLDPCLAPSPSFSFHLKCHLLTREACSDHTLYRTLVL